MSRRLAAVSVDLDAVHHYRAIHGLGAGPPCHQVHDIALPRLGEFAEREGVPLTLFAVGEDLERPESAEALRRLVRDGHEAANHSHRHRYDLTRLPPAEQRAEIELAIQAIARTTGVVPRGFRAPGYTITDGLLDLLESLGVRWDSSLFPCPPYYAAKALTLGALALRGRRSRSILGDPRVLLGPIAPYRTGRPYWRRGGGLLELPIQVTRRLRLPFIGTTLTLAGPRVAAWLAEGVLESPFVNLELHALDLLDTGDGLAELAPHQPDLAVPLERKQHALSAALGVLRRSGYRFVTLSEAAQLVA